MTSPRTRHPEDIPVIEKHFEPPLRDRAERFRSYFELGLIGMAITSPAKEIVEVNDEICRILGYERDELLIRTWAELTHPDDLSADVAQFERVMAREIDGYSIDKRFVRKDGRVIDATISVKAVRRADGAVDYFVALLQDVTFRKRAEEELRKQNEALQTIIDKRQAAEDALRRAHDELEQRVAARTAQLSAINVALVAEIAERKRAEAERTQILQRLMTAQEDERRRIARELHDQFGQQLSALKLQIGRLTREFGSPPSLQEQLHALDAIAGQFDRDIDFFVWEMRPMALDDLGLVVALDNYVKSWSRQIGVEAEFHSAGVDRNRLPSEIEIVLYRVTQEALTNVSKHAKATSASILLERRADSISLIVEDDGIGFDVEHTFSSAREGLGLVGMRERVGLVGGTLHLESRAGGGATVAVRIPIAAG